MARSLNIRVLMASSLGRMCHHRVSGLQPRQSLQAEWAKQVDSHRCSAFYVSSCRSWLSQQLTEDSLGDCGCVIARQVVTYTHPNANIPSASRSTCSGDEKC